MKEGAAIKRYHNTLRQSYEHENETQHGERLDIPNRIDIVSESKKLHRNITSSHVSFSPRKPRQITTYSL